MKIFDIPQVINQFQIIDNEIAPFNYQCMLYWYFLVFRTCVIRIFPSHKLDLISHNLSMKQNIYTKRYERRHPFPLLKITFDLFWCVCKKNIYQIFRLVWLYFWCCFFHDRKQMFCHFHTNEDIDIGSFLPFSRHRNSGIQMHRVIHLH